MFLLLIFFMVSSTFREEFGVDVTLPEARTATPSEKETHEITVSAQGEFFFGQARVTDEGLRDAVREAIAASPASSLVLRADESADFGRVLRAIDIAREEGGKRLIIPARKITDTSHGK